MSSVVPKERQTAYQRWEMASFDEAVAPPPPPPDAKVPTQDAMSRIKEQVALLRKEAWQSGHEEGTAAGRTEGYEEGRALGIEEGRKLGLIEGRAQAAEELLRLQCIAEGFGSEVAHANEAIAEDLLNLALDIAKAMLKTALEIKPDLVLPIVGEAVRYLPSLQQPALLFLHPADISLVKEHMDDELSQAGWRLAEDPHLEPGGCRIETASNQIDASLSSRWERLAASLGKESGWLTD